MNSVHDLSITDRSLFLGDVMCDRFLPGDGGWEGEVGVLLELKWESWTPAGRMRETSNGIYPSYG